MKFPALALLAIPLAACSSAPVATPADAVHIADATDAPTDPCGGLCGTGTVCAEGHCVAFDAGIEGPLDALRPVDAMDVAEDRGSDAPRDTGCPAHADRLPSGGCACVIGYRLCGDTCRDLDTDSANCGACGNVCAGACATGRCVAVPDAGIDVAGDTADAAPDPCGGSCVTRPHALTLECLAGGGGTCIVRMCERGFADCNSAAIDGCETDITTRSDCGACRRQCTPREVCTNDGCR